MLGGPENAPKAMSVEEIVELTMKELNAVGNDGKLKRLLLGIFPRRRWGNGGLLMVGLWRCLVLMGRG